MIIRPAFFKVVFPAGVLTRGKSYPAFVVYVCVCTVSITFESAQSAIKRVKNFPPRMYIKLGCNCTADSRQCPITDGFANVPG